MKLYILTIFAIFLLFPTATGAQEGEPVIDETAEITTEVSPETTESETSEVTTAESTSTEACLRITNITDHAEYLFIATIVSGSGEQSYHIVTPNNCIPAQNETDTITVYAVQKSNFTESDIDQSNPDSYFGSNGQFIKSSTALSLTETTGPVDYEVKVLTNSNFTLAKKGSTTESEPATGPFNQLKAGFDKVDTYMTDKTFPYWWLVIPIGILGIISLIVLFRRLITEKVS